MRSASTTQRRVDARETVRRRERRASSRTTSRSCAPIGNRRRRSARPRRAGRRGRARTRRAQRRGRCCATTPKGCSRVEWSKRRWRARGRHRRSRSRRTSTLFAGVTCVAPNAHEASMATGIPIRRRRLARSAPARALLERLRCRYVVITRGEHGMALFGSDGERMRSSVGRAHRLRRQRRRRYGHRDADARASRRRADRPSDAARELRRRRGRRETRHRDGFGRARFSRWSSRPRTLIARTSARCSPPDEAAGVARRAARRGRDRRLYQRRLRRTARRARRLPRLGARAGRRARS